MRRRGTMPCKPQPQAARAADRGAYCFLGPIGRGGHTSVPPDNGNLLGAAAGAAAVWHRHVIDDILEHNSRTWHARVVRAQTAALSRTVIS